MYPREFMIINPAREPVESPSTGWDLMPDANWTSDDTVYAPIAIPEGALTRGEFVHAIATRLYTVHTLQNCFTQLAWAPDVDFHLLFTDLNIDSPYAHAVCAGMMNGWLRGNPDGSFGPNEMITAAEATAILSRVSPEMSARKRAMKPGEAWYAASWEAFVAVSGLKMRPADQITGMHLGEWTCALSNGTTLSLDPLNECEVAGN